jgi:hypothetical protein
MMERFCLESRFGGFTDIDGKAIFDLGVDALAASKDVVLDFGSGQGTCAKKLAPTHLGLRVLNGKMSKVSDVDVDERGTEKPFQGEFRPLHPGDGWSGGPPPRIFRVAFHAPVHRTVLDHTPNVCFFDKRGLNGYKRSS